MVYAIAAVGVNVFDVVSATPKKTATKAAPRLGDGLNYELRIMNRAIASSTSLAAYVVSIASGGPKSKES